ncbi:MAG: beta-glucosidase BglX [Bacteroidales bacterium]
MRHICLLIIFTLAYSCTTKQIDFKRVRVDEKYEIKVDSVLALMTLDEKIGQLNQYTGNWQATGPVIDDPTKIDQIRAGRVGSMLNIKGAEQTRRMQDCAMESRLQIPLLFALDVIHGMRTIYPIPLGESASFDLDLMKRTAAGAAKEAASQGIHWTFAPMIDISRDARWGRVMEGAGEDTYYGTLAAVARVQGFQGDDLSSKSTVLACAKHFAAYGAAIAGKDYNTVDISELTLHDTYLPPFRAAVDAGVATFMNSFNDINGIPATAHITLQRNLQKGDWGFIGLNVSDWGSIGEMIAHGYSSDLREAAKQAILSGCDMDMESRAYHTHLKELITEGEVDISYLDDAVRRVLLKKFELGLFEDPYRYCDTVYENETVLSKELKDLSREAGKKSIVLLKNKDNILPLSSVPGSIAVIGALANSQIDMLGFWANEGVVDEVVTPIEGLRHRYPDSQINFIEGYDLETNKLHNISSTIAKANESDIVIVAIGERYFNSGEAKSRAEISIPSSHQKLVHELKKGGKPIIVLLMGGRPMIFNEMEPYSDAIVLTWWLGTEAGNAIADVISGDYNPSAKLPMTFPKHVGQIPIYYNYKSTGRPESSEVNYSTKYQDIDFKPAYEFGFGLSYSKFEISDPIVSKREFSLNDTIPVSVRIKNTGRVKGKELVQLYLRDITASVTRPVKELKAFRSVELEPDEERILTFNLSKDNFQFLNSNLESIVEKGLFKIMIGNSSLNLKDVNIMIK